MTGWSIAVCDDGLGEAVSQQVRFFQAFGAQAYAPSAVRTTDGACKAIEDASADELRELDACLQEAGLSCAQIDSTVGEAALTTDLDGQFARLDGAIQAARILGARFVRVFAGRAANEAEALQRHREAADRFERLAAYTARKEPAVTLTLQNHHAHFAATPDECLAFIARAVDRTAMCFDPGEFVRAGVRPLDEAWPRLGPLTRLLCLHDRRADEGAWVQPGGGDAQIAALLAAADPLRVAFLRVAPDPHAVARNDARWTATYRAIGALLGGTGA